MSQYDQIGNDYNIIKTLPFNRLEQYNFRKAVQPFLSQPNTSVLDFACGTGFYSELLLLWGAPTITGMDLSPTMVDGASKRLPAAVSSGRARFVVGDGFVSQLYPHPPLAQPTHAQSGNFDLATGVWFLNYASTRVELTSMFRSIATNLAPHGVFVGIVPQPSNHIENVAVVFNRPPLSRLFPRIEYTAELESGEGWHTHIFANDDGVDFWAYHLKQEIFELAAREGGMNGKLEWQRQELLEDPEWRREFNLNSEEWKVMEETPQFGLLVVRKE